MIGYIIGLVCASRGHICRLVFSSIMISYIERYVGGIFTWYFSAMTDIGVRGHICKLALSIRCIISMV